MTKLIRGVNEGCDPWIRPSWLARDGRRKFILVAFVTAITIALLHMLLGCGAIVDTLPYGSVL